MTPLDESIKKTISYFSIFNYPLTKEELFACLWQPPRIGYDEFVQKISTDCENIFEENNGYYSLRSKADSGESRRRRLIYAEQKLKIAVRAAKKIRSVPFLRAIFVCNSVGAEIADRESDIDFFILSAPGRVWLVRFFSNIILRFFGLRTYGAKNRNKICLSFYVDTNNLNLQPFCAVDPDIHFAYWLNQMIPVYDPENFYSKFLSANRWTEKFLPNMRRKSEAGYLFGIKDSKPGRLWKKIWEIIWGGVYGNLIEGQAKSVQTMRLKPSLKEAAARADMGVILSDQVLKFHENDSRRDMLEKWKKLSNV